ncbi:N(1)-aminopropylagmatine ureohydrolase [Candidatus Nitrosocosmicus franklandus]|uniref:N(1)-aminopropylagmatine ureohydrolase n=2 Tax=Candidatus Nitrosocosmicus franklandianus TaxID=1798806 RepID=A0A484IBD4_9ARCH|nr:N(1)-aminopropylagmatine ureohydrolase [Candidatus Nitrosocosmicus franklandus]
MFTRPEYTLSGCNFCDIPIPVTFDNANVVVFGAPIDITTTFGKTTSMGPHAIRTTSSKQIETLVYEKNIEIYDKALVYDLGDIKSDNSDYSDVHDLEKIESFWNNFDEKISVVITLLRDTQKIPVILGGEHTITYSIFKWISRERPLLLHFDAHRDMKSTYEGMTMCHTTPFYHLIENGYLRGQDLVQIGIRQGDRNENQFALRQEVTTFDAWNCHNDFDEIKSWIRNNTRNRKIYVSFDIDVYDLSYVSCTGTPEPYGLSPFQIVDLINSIDESAVLTGVDFVETGFKNNDFREGALATQTLLRILTGDFMSKKASKIHF